MQYFYTNSIYEVFIFPFSLAFYISLFLTILIFIGFIIYLYTNKIFNLLFYIFFIINFIFILWCKKNLLVYYLKYFIQCEQIVFFLSISTIVNFLFSTIIILLGSLLLPIIFGLILKEYGIKKSKNILFLFVVISGILAPPDYISHLILSAFMSLLFYTTQFMKLILKRFLKNKHK